MYVYMYMYMYMYADALLTYRCVIQAPQIKAFSMGSYPHLVKS